MLLIPQGTWGQQGAAQPLGGSNVSELAEEAERAKGSSSLLTGASAQGEGTPDAKSWGTRRPLGMACVFYFPSFFSNIPPISHML
ncbi:MAG: hypothetical protein J0L96_06385 [Anaerolineae bacterium]|nr:hypothetical protein [Anaerolineae bacterium]